MGMLKEFQKFAVKGKAIDMAVGLVVGAAIEAGLSLPPPLLQGQQDLSASRHEESETMC